MHMNMKAILWIETLRWPNLEFQVLELMDFTETKFTAKWEKIKLGLGELVLIADEKLDNKLGGLYSPSKPRFPLRSFSLET